MSLAKSFKRAVGGAARAAANRPILRRCLLRLLDIVPALKPRLKHLFQLTTMRPMAPEDLSPQAQRVYRRLKRQQQDREAS